MALRIVVGVDGSVGSQRALEWLAPIARRLDANVVAVHVAGLVTHDAAGAVVPEAGLRSAEIDDLRARCSVLVEHGVDVRLVVRDGSPVPTILALADEVGAGLIVVGSRGLGGFPELLLGSTSTQLAQHATVPVMIVPAGTY